MDKVQLIQQAIANAEESKSKLTEEILALSAFNTVAIKHLLNNLGAISNKYIECGLHKAGGFISALYGNELIGMGIDNWSEFEESGLSKKIAFENCDKYLDETKYGIRDADCFSLGYGSGPINIPIKDVDFYTYDANHGFESQYKGIVHFQQFLAKEFILVVDDTEWENPRMATLKAIEDLKLEVLFHVHLFDGKMGGKWWNGVDVFYLKKPNHE